MKRHMIIFFSALVSTGTMAGTMGAGADQDGWWNPQEPCAKNETYLRAESPWSYVITGNLGPAFNNNTGETQTFYLQPDIKKTYQALATSNTLIYGELFLGMQKHLSEKFFGQLGVAIAGGTAANLSGDIWEDANPAFNNYTYTYNIKEARVLLKGKLLMDSDYLAIRPYISAGLGIGFNASQDFTITPRIPEEVPAPAFQNNTTTPFTYSLGLGIHKKINDDWQTGLGYEFSDWGRSQLGAAPGQTLNQGLVQTHLYINAVVFSLTYII